MASLCFIWLTSSTSGKIDFGMTKMPKTMAEFCDLSKSSYIYIFTKQAARFLSWVPYGHKLLCNYGATTKFGSSRGKVFN